MTEDKILNDLRKAVLEYNSAGAVSAAKAAIASKMDPVKAIEKGLVPSIETIGEKFDPYRLRPTSHNYFKAAMAVMAKRLLTRCCWTSVDMNSSSLIAIYWNIPNRAFFLLQKLSHLNFSLSLLS